MNKINSSVYARKVELLLRLIPIVMDEEVFAIHGGTAINLFLKDLPRYSVDIDLTYIPLFDRETSFDDI
uniref:nucleotidyl transferase AbiEii/AbiGii toxin family protein n=1 Tax=Prevotella koreensis TaxID=2490854 RepID=UPI0028E92EAB